MHDVYHRPYQLIVQSQYHVLDRLTVLIVVTLIVVPLQDVSLTPMDPIEVKKNKKKTIKNLGQNCIHTIVDVDIYFSVITAVVVRVYRICDCGSF